MDIQRDAKISADGRYRYFLSRIWRSNGDTPPSRFTWIPPKQLVFVMLNPSTADAYEDDPTIRRCVGFGQRDDYDMVHVANLYAGRATKPSALFEMDDPVGSENTHVWGTIRASSATIVCAWGAEKRAKDQAARFLKFMEGRELHCLGLTKDGHPKHPLYLKADTPIEVWKATPSEEVGDGR